MDPDDDPLLDLFEKLASQGFITSRTMAAELNRLGHKAPKGGIWHQKQCLRVAERLSRDYADYDSPFVSKPKKPAPAPEKGRARHRNALAVTMVERLHAKTLRSRLDMLRAEGVTQPSLIATLLNSAGLIGFRGKPWTAQGVKLLIELSYPPAAPLLRWVKPVALEKK